MVQIFDNPDVVMTKYVEAVMDRVLQVSGEGGRITPSGLVVLSLTVLHLSLSLCRSRLTVSYFLCLRVRLSVSATCKGSMTSTARP